MRLTMFLHTPFVLLAPDNTHFVGRAIVAATVSLLRSQYVHIRRIVVAEALKIRVLQTYDVLHELVLWGSALVR